VSSNNGVNVQHESDKIYFATDTSNKFTDTILVKNNLNSIFTRLPSNSWITVDLNTYISHYWWSKITFYNAIKDINWWIWSPRQMNGNNASFGINNNVSLWGRYKISDYLTEAQFNNTTNLKLFYKSSTEIWVFHWTLANIGIANYGTDQTKHSVNNLRQQSSTALWWTLQNWYLYLNDTFGKVIYFDNNGIGFLDKSLLSNYSWRWIPYLDWWNYYWSGANRLVFGDNNWNANIWWANNGTWWWINMAINLWRLGYRGTSLHWNMVGYVSNSNVSNWTVRNQNWTTNIDSTTTWTDIFNSSTYRFFPLY